MRCFGLSLCIALLGCSSPPAERPPPAAEPAAGQHPVHARVVAGCRSEAECRALYTEALRRSATCQPSYTCGEARRDVSIAAGYVRLYADQRAAGSQFWHEQPAPRAAQEDEARRAREAEAEEQKRRADAEEQKRRAAAEAEAAERARIEAPQKAAEEQRAPAAADPAPEAPAPKSAPGRVCCCDGTVSPTCTYVKRGCCSHHGGVCGCE